MEIDKALLWLDMRIDGAQAIIVSGGGDDWVQGAVEWQAEAKNARDCIAALTAEVERRNTDAENWRLLYREVYCTIWCATGEEFDAVSFGEGLAHDDTLKELAKMIRCQMSQKEPQ